ncbi:protein disulfide oxidoreductase [Thiomicrorhabdus sp.]|uniref:protein disulfide oxidoreductase n=1 Tax=Thiomicrorhabdus sp. TaxID=2039724 RepID=UPI0029C821E6|nr:protein disulfide oxidoreductase [Thiomicrorhabdus sp.]
MTSLEKQPSFWQKNWVKNLLTFGLFITILLILRPYMQGDVIQGKAPDLKLTSLSGQSIDLYKELAEGEPVLIHIWATWCPICKFSRDSVESLSEDHKVISIVTQSGNSAEIQAYVQEHQLNPDHLFIDADGKLMQLFGAKGVPADFIIDEEGNIDFVEVGFTTSLGLKLRLWMAAF